MPSRRLFASWFVALALLFGQAAAFAHALEHLHGHEPGLPDQVCEVCVAHAPFGAALPPAALAAPVPAFVPFTAAPTAQPLPDSSRIAARARAPPARSA